MPSCRVASRNASFCKGHCTKDGASQLEKTGAKDDTFNAANMQTRTERQNAMDLRLCMELGEATAT